VLPSPLSPYDLRAAGLGRLSSSCQQERNSMDLVTIRLSWFFLSPLLVWVRIEVFFLFLFLSLYVFRDAPPIRTPWSSLPFFFFHPLMKWKETIHLLSPLPQNSFVRNSPPFSNPIVRLKDTPSFSAYDSVFPLSFAVFSSANAPPSCILLPKTRIWNPYSASPSFLSPAGDVVNFAHCSSIHPFRSDHIVSFPYRRHLFHLPWRLLYFSFPERVLFALSPPHLHLS